MIGLGILLFLCIWGAIALLIANLIGKKLLRRFTKNAEGDTTGKGTLIILLLSVLVFFAPILDQLIAYPKWQQLCATTGDFEWGPGMDKYKALNRKTKSEEEYTEFTIFPNIKVYSWSKSLFDADTNELIYKKPHFRYSARSFMYIPAASGDKTPLLLPSCEDYSIVEDGEDLDRKIDIN